MTATPHCVYDVYARRPARHMYARESVVVVVVVAWDDALCAKFAYIFTINRQIESRSPAAEHRALYSSAIMYAHCTGSRLSGPVGVYYTLRHTYIRIYRKIYTGTTHLTSRLSFFSFFSFSLFCHLLFSLSKATDFLHAYYNIHT